MFAPGKLFQLRSPPQREAPEIFFTWVGSCYTRKHYTILERLARDEHSSLLRKFLTYGRKTFHSIGPDGQADRWMDGQTEKIQVG